MTPSFYRTDLSDQALKAWQNAHPELAPDFGEPLPPMELCHDYDNKEITMTTPPTLSPAEKFRADMMSLLNQMRKELTDVYTDIDAIQHDIATIRAGLQHAASDPAHATKSFIANSIVHSIDENGHDAYKMRGGCYAKNGVRIWPEVLPILGIAEPVQLGITQLTPPLNVLVEMHNFTDPVTRETRITPYKVIGLAPA